MTSRSVMARVPACLAICAAAIALTPTAGGSVVSAGPIALALKATQELLILQTDGRVFSLDARREVVREIYRVPAKYQPMDLSIGYRGGPDYCVTLNSRVGSGSFLLQLLPDNRQVWTNLAQRGLVVGVVIDARRRSAYVTQAFDNVVHRLPLGEEKARPFEIVSLPQASRIGALALDSVKQRLFVADLDGSDIFVVNLGSGAVQRVPLKDVSDPRALAWSPATDRLYVADAGHRTVWAVDVSGGNSQTEAFSDKRIYEPSALAVADRTLWVADKRSRRLFEVALADRAVTRVVPVAPAEEKR